MGFVYGRYSFKLCPHRKTSSCKEQVPGASVIRSCKGSVCMYEVWNTGSQCKPWALPSVEERSPESLGSYSVLYNPQKLDFDIATFVNQTSC